MMMGAMDGMDTTSSRPLPDDQQRRGNGIVPRAEVTTVQVHFRTSGGTCRRPWRMENTDGHGLPRTHTDGVENDG